MCDKHCVIRPDCRVCNPTRGLLSPQIPEQQVFTAEQLKAHGPVIMEWLAGKRIQFRAAFDSEWRDCDPPSNPNGKPMWFQTLEYRVKPEPVKCEPYRRYIVKECATHYMYVYRPNHGTVAGVEGRRNFVRWVDKEWQYEEV